MKSDLKNGAIVQPETKKIQLQLSVDKYPTQTPQPWWPGFISYLKKKIKKTSKTIEKSKIFLKIKK